MSLTEVELQSLQEIAQEVRRTSPRLASGLSRGRPRPQAVTVVTVVVLVCLVATLTVGVVWQLPVLCAVVWSAFIPLTVVRGIFVDDGY